MCDSEGDEGSSSHGVWETRVVTGSEVESGSLEEGKEEKEGKRRVGRWGRGEGEEEEREREGRIGEKRERRRERGEGKQNIMPHVSF